MLLLVENVKKLKRVSSNATLLLTYYDFALSGSELELQLVLLDTVFLCGNTGHDDSSEQPQGKSLFC